MERPSTYMVFEPKTKRFYLTSQLVAVGKYDAAVVELAKELGFTFSKFSPLGPAYMNLWSTDSAAIALSAKDKINPFLSRQAIAQAESM